MSTHIIRNIATKQSKSINTMFYVLKIYSSVSPSVMLTTENKDDAFKYAEIMHRTDDYEYIVTEEIKA